MSRKPATSVRLFDFAAISLSGLCLLHCLALPVLAAFLPLLAVWAEAEWVHAAFVAFALPLTGTALWRAHRQRPLPLGLIVLAVGGLTGLLLGALPWSAESLEVPLTVTGGLMLASAHLWNWKRRPHAHAAS